MNTGLVELDFLGVAARIDVSSHLRIKLRAIPVENPISGVLEVRRSFGSGNAPAVPYAVVKTLKLDGTEVLDLDVSDTPGLSLWVTTSEADASIEIEYELIGLVKYQFLQETLDLSFKGRKTPIPLDPNMSIGSFVYRTHEHNTKAAINTIQIIGESGRGFLLDASTPLDQSLSSFDITGVSDFQIDCVSAQSVQSAEMWFYATESFESAGVTRP